MRNRRRGITLLELLVVLAIIGLLATIAFSVYSSHHLRARVAATAMQIRELTMAIEQYRNDLGEYPPSSSGTSLWPDPIDPSNVQGEGAVGCGYLITALVTSLSGDPYNPAAPRWQGPYLELQPSRLGTITGQALDPNDPLVLPQVQLLDSFGMPFYYIRSVDYAAFMGTEIPDDSPFASEIYFNPSTFQLVSFGLNGYSFPREQMGLDVDDITNFAY
jgi:prepilin-type N-terminal cleavage/methylation domain-containing protein